MEQNKNINTHFLSLVVSLAGATWQALGKVPSPMTNKIEKNIQSAKVSIDMLEMVKEKTKGNLSSEEQKLLDNTVADLQLNYVEEVKIEETAKKDSASENKKTEVKEEKKEGKKEEKED